MLTRSFVNGRIRCGRWRKELESTASPLVTVLERLAETKPGFLITAIEPSDELRNGIKKQSRPAYFSLTNFEGSEFVTIGEENCSLLGQFMDLVRTLAGKPEKHPAEEALKNFFQPCVLGQRKREFLD